MKEFFSNHYIPFIFLVNSLIKSSCAIISRSNVIVFNVMMLKVYRIQNSFVQFFECYCKEKTPISHTTKQIHDSDPITYQERLQVSSKNYKEKTHIKHVSNTRQIPGYWIIMLFILLFRNIQNYQNLIVSLNNKSGYSDNQYISGIYLKDLLVNITQTTVKNGQQKISLWKRILLIAK